MNFYAFGVNVTQVNVPYMYPVLTLHVTHVTASNVLESEGVGNKMVKYWLHIFGAYLLLRAASSLMKDAEKLVMHAADRTPMKVVATEEIVDAEVVTA
jgi:hypothetical protein